MRSQSATGRSASFSGPNRVENELDHVETTILEVIISQPAAPQEGEYPQKCENTSAVVETEVSDD